MNLEKMHNVLEDVTRQRDRLLVLIYQALDKPNGIMMDDMATAFAAQRADRKRIAALEQELEDNAKAMLNRDLERAVQREEISTLTQALALARGALEYYAQTAISARAVDALASLDLPAAGGGEDEWITQKAKEEDGAMVLGGRLNLPKQWVHTSHIVDTETMERLIRHTACHRESFVEFAAAPAPTPGLVWTMDKPTVPGAYWKRHPEFGVEVVNVTVNMCTAPHNKPIHEYSDECQWAGPLPEPLKGA